MIVFSLETVETGRYKQHIVIPGIVKRVSHCNSRAEFAPNANGAFLSNTCADCVIKLWFTLVLGAAAARWRPLLKRLYCRLSTMVAEKYQVETDHNEVGYNEIGATAKRSRFSIPFCT